MIRHNIKKEVTRMTKKKFDPGPDPPDKMKKMAEHCIEPNDIDD